MTAADARDRGADLVWDTSTLRKGLQRQFFASLLEMTGSPVQIVEQTATELARLVDPRVPVEGRKRLYAGFEDPTPIQHQVVDREDPRTSIQHQIWWTEELLRPDSIYQAILLDADGSARYDRLMESFAAAEVLPGRPPETRCDSTRTPSPSSRPPRSAARSWSAPTRTSTRTASRQTPGPQGSTGRGASPSR